MLSALAIDRIARPILPPVRNKKREIPLCLLRLIPFPV